MFGIYATNPDESLCASIAWTLWTEGRLATDLLAGALPGIEQHVYWTPPFYYLVLAGWQGLWGPGLLSIRSLSLVLGLAVLVVLWSRRRSVGPATWTASAFVLFDPVFQRAASMGRPDMLAIALTVGSLVILEGGRDRRRCLAAGALAAAAILTHPLGAAALIAVGLTCLRGGRPSLVPFIQGSAPLLLAWAAYISLDVGTFVAQMQLQLAVKAGRVLSPLDNLHRLGGFYGRYLPIAVACFVGGAAGLVIARKSRLPWLIGAACLAPVALFSGEFIYPAYLVPFSAVGLGELLARSRRGRAAVVAVVVVAGVELVTDPPPLAGIDPGYQDYCDYVSARLAADHTALLAIVPDPWFGLLETRPDLRLRLAPPVSIPTPQLQAYVRRADDVVFGGYNSPGFRTVIEGWDVTATDGQQLWLLNRGRLHNYEDVRDEIRVHW